MPGDRGHLRRRPRRARGGARRPRHRGARRPPAARSARLARVHGDRRAGSRRAAASHGGGRRGDARGPRRASRCVPRRRFKHREPGEAPRDRPGRPGAGRLGGGGDRRGRRGPLEDPVQRERQGAGLVGIDVRARSQRGRRLDRAVRTLARRDRPPPRRRGPGDRRALPALARDRRGCGRVDRRGPDPRTLGARPPPGPDHAWGSRERLRRDPSGSRPDAGRRDPAAEGRARRGTPEGVPRPGDGVVEPIVEAIRARTDLRPVAGIVLGSGLGDAITGARDRAGSGEPVEIPYAELPGFPPPTVPGHAGKLWLGTIPGGSIVVVRDHLNLMGRSPLAGWRYPDGSPAFVDVSEVYDRTLADAALGVLRKAGTPTDEGVYAAMAGPSYETPAETEMLRRLGATVVGMSTVPEAVVARALGMRVLGLSFVTNAAGASVSHEEVLLASKTAAEAIGRIVAELVDAF